MRYFILDPTGNITALVLDEIATADQPRIAASLMEQHRDVEQVGFVSFTSDAQSQVSLRMAGGEFCGNATMSAAALYALLVNPHATSLRVRASGAHDPVSVRLRATGDDSFDAWVRMPEAEGICTQDFSYGGIVAGLPLVRMRGISHLIVQDTSPHFALRERPLDAEKAIKDWCDRLEADGLGLMFLDSNSMLTPLVYVPGSNTVFWERSCASGSSAIGMFLAHVSHSPISVALSEPGGMLRVQSSDQGTILQGSVRLQHMVV